MGRMEYGQWRYSKCVHSAFGLNGQNPMCCYSSDALEKIDTKLVWLKKLDGKTFTDIDTAENCASCAVYARKR